MKRFWADSLLDAMHREAGNGHCLPTGKARRNGQREFALATYARFNHMGPRCDSCRIVNATLRVDTDDCVLCADCDEKKWG